MNAKPTKEHLDAFVAHAMATLPDSLKLRKIVLVTTLNLLPRTCEQRQEVKAMLETIHAHERIQLKFSALLDGEVK